MDTSTENRSTPVIAGVRRQSDQGVLRASVQNVTGQGDTKRRKTLSGALPRSSTVEESDNQFPQEEEIVISPPRKTPSKHRISLGAAHAYYFKSTSKTPLNKETSFQDLNESVQQHTSDVTANVAELSFLSLAGSTGSNSTGNDTLNQSVLSDTTELTASNFILASSSRQRLAEFTKLAAERKQDNGRKDNVLPEKDDARDGTDEPSLALAATNATPSDNAMFETLSADPVPKECVENVAMQSEGKKDTIDVRRFSMGTASALRHVPSPVTTGRKSWHGTPGSVDVESSVLKYRELAATMKQVRLARGQQRQDEIKTRLSSMSNASRMTDRSDLMSNTSFLSTPSESPSSGSRGDIDTEMSTRIDVSAVDSRSLDDLFEGLVPTSASRSVSSVSKKVIQDSSGTIPAELSVSRKASRPHEPTSAQKALTPTKLSASPRRVVNPLSIDSPARNTRSASKHELDASAMSHNSMDSDATSSPNVETSVLSPFKQPTSAQKALTPTKLSTSPRRIVNPLSIDSPARNTRSASKHDMDASAMSHNSMDSDATSTPNVEVSVLSPFKQPTSAQKALTPTKLSASPRRVVNPLSIDSPARNTRSASKHDMDSSAMSEDSVDIEATPSPNVEVSVLSPFKQPTSAQKALTPTKLSASPRRVVNPLSIDSPARNTRSASKHDMDSSAMSEDSVDIEATPSPNVEVSVLSPFKQPTSAQKALTPTKLSTSPRRVVNSMSTDSPARNTRSASRASSKSPLRFSGQRSVGFAHNDVTPSRNNKTDTNRRNDVGEKVQASLGSEQHRASILHSSLRKQGSARKVGNAVRHVEFGSPEFAEFNKGSPSMNLTPMPVAKLRVVETMPEDTVEIEADMNALLNGIPPQSSFPVGSPSISEQVDQVKYTQESACDMSLESLSESKEQETVQLEMNMEELLHDPSAEKNGFSAENTSDDMYLSAKELEYGNPDNSMDVDESHMDDGEVTNHHTVSLEANMSELFKSNADADNDKSTEVTSHTFNTSLAQDTSDNVRNDTSKRGGLTLEEDNTVELEMDMGSLLMATEFDLEASMTASPRTIGNRRRRSSISSRRFSLAPESRLSLSTDGEIVSPHDNDEGDESLTELNESAPASVESPVTWKDVFSALSTDLEKAPSSADFLEEVTRLLRDAEYGITLNAVYSQIVDHIEETTDPPLDDNSRPILPDLQLAISSGNHQKYEVLAHNVQVTELKKWTNWLVSVADTLAGPLNELCVEFSQKSQILDDKCSWIQESHHILSSLEQQAALRARKRSFFQRKQLVDSLQNEVSNLKEDLAMAKGILNKANDRYMLSVDVTNEVARNRALVERRDISLPRAESLARKYSYAKGMHRWKAPVISGSELSFHYIGPTTDACVVLSFTVSKRGEVKYLAKPSTATTEYVSKSLQCIRVPLLTPFVKARTEAICNELSGQVLSDTSQISEVLRHFQWQMGRLEQTAMELLVLRRRHGAFLTSSGDDGSTFRVEVDFSGTPSKLSASFELTAEYPFAPLNVILNTFEGSVDIEKVRALLVKNAKPGFGYLSRTCDVISASVR